MYFVLEVLFFSLIVFSGWVTWLRFKDGKLKNK